MYLRPIPICLALIAAALCHGQAAPAGAQQAIDLQVQEPVQGGWHATEKRSIPEDDTEKLQIMQDKKLLHPTSMEATFHQMRSDRNSALARNKGSLTEQDKHQLTQQAQIIEDQAPNSFEAHMGRYYAEFPAPHSFQHLDRAAMRDPQRNELIGPKLADAARRDNKGELHQWSRAMRDRGEVAPGLWAFADDLLRSVDQNGILIAAGEMDAYPLWTRQFADGLRKDVFVVDVRLLEDPAYRQRIWEEARARGAVPKGSSTFITELAEATDRPLFLSPALGADKIQMAKEKLFVVGLALQYGRSPLNNIPQLEKRWSQMSKTTEAGPLSRNYLLPGVVLLKYYREQQDEQKASLMEHELRELAKELGATQDLYRMGVFEH